MKYIFHTKDIKSSNNAFLIASLNFFSHENIDISKFIQIETNKYRGYIEILFNCGITPIKVII